MRLFGPVAPVCEGPVPIPSAFRHASTFERVIGFKCGTGGTGDVNYGSSAEFVGSFCAVKQVFGLNSSICIACGMLHRRRFALSR